MPTEEARHAGAGTSAEELLAAAHAACFSMAPSLARSQAGHPPRSVKTTGRVHLRNVGGIPTIQQIDLETAAEVPGLGETSFQRRAEEAKTGCIVSRTLGGVERINLVAELAT